jgi:D-alanine-D-alanine ligase
MEDGGTQTGGSEKIKIPAEINEDVKIKIQKYSKEVFEKLSGNGIMRIDFLLNTENGELFLNEINTLPGTLYHHL